MLCKWLCSLPLLSVRPKFATSATPLLMSSCTFPYLTPALLLLWRDGGFPGSCQHWWPLLLALVNWGLSAICASKASDSLWVSMSEFISSSCEYHCSLPNTLISAAHVANECRDWSRQVWIVTGWVKSIRPSCTEPKLCSAEISESWLEILWLATVTLSIGLLCTLSLRDVFLAKKEVFCPFFFAGHLFQTQCPVTP